MVVVVSDEKHVFPYCGGRTLSLGFFMQSFSSALSLGVFPTHWNTNKLTVELTSERAVLINKHFQDCTLDWKSCQIFLQISCNK